MREQTLPETIRLMNEAQRASLTHRQIAGPEVEPNNTSQTVQPGPISNQETGRL